jgi:hypothetical protein
MSAAVSTASASLRNDRVTSSARAAANRRNATRSTGPRTAQGKARAAQNAHKHGLARSVFDSPTLAAEIENLARLIAGPAADPQRLSHAAAIAAADIDLRRIREERRRLYMQGPLNAKSKMRRDRLAASEAASLTSEVSDEGRSASADGGREKATWPWQFALLNIKAMERIERYEGRALSRRKRAIRALDAMEAAP